MVASLMANRRGENETSQDVIYSQYQNHCRGYLSKTIVVWWTPQRGLVYAEYLHVSGELPGNSSFVRMP